MKLKQITTPFDYQPVAGYKQEEKDAAIPDNSYSLRELYQKYSLGTIQAVALKGQYDEDDAPFDAPLSPDRLHLNDPVDVEQHVETEIKPYIDEVQNIANSKIASAAMKKQGNSSNDATTTNDDATNKNKPTGSSADENAI